MTTALTISGTWLSQLGRYNPCYRCIWIGYNVRPLPYQSFPGIFSTIDSYNKKIVHSYIDEHHKLPDWLASLGTIDHYIKPPHYSKFSILHEQSGITLRGEADAMFRMTDNSLTIIDYKTSRYSKNQEYLVAGYEVQLNAYAFIANELGMGPVKRLALVYMEPLTEKNAISEVHSVIYQSGFLMQFKPKIIVVNLHPDKLIPNLLSKAQQVLQSPTAPNRSPTCKNCAATDALTRVAIANPS
jgi:CRISPR/Cas system-associated exonuclease Cas4 (RecB family)